MSMGLWPVRDLYGAIGVGLLSVAWLVIVVMVLPGMARLQAWPGRRLLAPDPGTDLALRVAQLTATRAAALDAHATELRRIERSLHDGTQNRIVAVTVLVGAARRALARDPAVAEEILERAQDAAEQALAELRGVVRSILPPVLTDRSLADALTGLPGALPDRRRHPRTVRRVRRGHGLLRGGRDAHQHRQAQPGPARHRHGPPRRRPAPPSDGPLRGSRGPRVVPTVLGPRGISGCSTHAATDPFSAGGTSTTVPSARLRTGARLGRPRRPNCSGFAR